MLRKTLEGWSKRAGLGNSVQTAVDPVMIPPVEDFDPPTPIGAGTAATTPGGLYWEKSDLRVVLVLRDRRRENDPITASVRTPSERPTRRSLVASGLITTAGAALLIGWVWALPAAAIWALAMVVGRPWTTRVIGLAGATIVVGAGLIVTFVVRTDNPFPDAGWPLRFEWLHGWTLLGVILVVGASLAAPGRERSG